MNKIRKILNIIFVFGFLFLAFHIMLFIGFDIITVTIRSLKINKTMHLCALLKSTTYADESLPYKDEHTIGMWDTISFTKFHHNAIDDLHTYIVTDYRVGNVCDCEIDNRIGFLPSITSLFSKEILEALDLLFKQYGPEKRSSHTNQTPNYLKLQAKFEKIQILCDAYLNIIEHIDSGGIRADEFTAIVKQHYWRYRELKKGNIEDFEHMRQILSSLIDQCAD